MEVKNCAKVLKPITSYGSHAHVDSVEIVYQINGSYTMTAEGKSYKIKQGDVIIMPPNITHSGIGDGESYTDMYVQCTGCEFKEVQVVHDTDGAILPLMEMIYRAITERGDGYHKIADSLLEAICAYLTRYVNKKTKYEFVDRFKGLLYENLSNPDFDVSEEIEKSGYSKDHFRRCFKEETGLTPLEHLTVLRINRAKKLLCSTPRQSVELIAESCGFSDTFYFSRVFKKSVGLSPSEYRKSKSEG
jgi:AraC-like DNA-binding protein